MWRRGTSELKIASALLQNFLQGTSVKAFNSLRDRGNFIQFVIMIQSPVCLRKDI